MIEKIFNNLKQRGFKPVICKTSDDAVKTLLDLVPVNDVVGSGGSVTLSQLSIPQKMIERGTTYYSHSTVSEEQKSQVYQLARSGQWYLSSANAITQNGEIINIDGSANRVSTLIFGVPNIVYIIGKNKFVKDYNEAIERIKTHTCPLNAVRLGKSTPCAITGKCGNCSGKECMCNVTTIVHHPTRYQENVYVILVEEELGY